VEAETEPDIASLTDVLTPYAIRVAVTLGYADTIGDEPVSAAVLAERHGVDPPVVARLMRYLACRGIFRETEDGNFAHTAASRKLRSDDPSNWKPWLKLGSMADRMDRVASLGLLEAVLLNKASYPRMCERSVWDDIDQDIDFAESFDAMMCSRHDLWVPGVVDYDWGEVRRVVDVGGGTGALLAALLAAWPNLTAALVDVENNTLAAGDFFAQQGILGRVEVVTGSFFDALPEADAYLLAHVLHDWEDEDAVRILRRCREGAGSGGRVLVVERVVDATQNPREATRRDLLALGLFGNDERDLTSFTRLAGKAGLAERTRTPLSGDHWLVEYIVD
jgi:SAM-dependent methyltransferase